ncbi:MAG: Mrp/NBP35 family ATP-binding protein [Anaerolineae bacterium]|nr:Mrp/NBP35 family ATP-binding protein [Anaerolineae bacterium]
MSNESEVLETLRQIYDPELRRNIVDLGMVRNLQTNNGVVNFTLALTIPECPLRDQLVNEARTATAALPGVTEVNINLGAMNMAERRAAFGISSRLLPETNQVKQVITIMSGKGGVGKSLVTGLLAVGLKQAGYRAGILDADVTGPSIPRLFGVHGPVQIAPGNRLQPVTSRTGIKLMSVNFLLEDEGQAVIWRGPIVSQAIQQFWSDVNWGQLDYLLVDLPPGTSDAALTVMQSLPLDGIIMVTTPQALAAMVVRKAVKMAQSINVPILGVVENMAGFVAPDTGHHYDIFGPSHTQEIAEAAGASVLARLPLRPEVATLCDEGAVEAVTAPEVTPLVQELVRLASVSHTAVQQLTEMMAV